MGTRSITRFWRQEEDQPVLSLYAQWDGYPTGHGAILKAILDPIEEITNGIRMDDVNRVTVNGPEELPIYTIVRLKERQLAERRALNPEMPDAFPVPANAYVVGTYYIDPGHDLSYVDYAYDVRVIDGAIHLTVLSPGAHLNSPAETLYDGPVRDFDPQHVEDEWHKKCEASWEEANK